MLKTRVSQFTQFLRSTPSLMSVYKTAEYARLGSDGDITLTETPKITAELAEFFRTVIQLEASGSSRVSRNAVSPTLSLNAALRAVSPPNGDDALSRARSASVASSSFAPECGEVPTTTAAAASSGSEAPLPKECFDKSIHALVEVTSVSSGKDSPLPMQEVDAAPRFAMLAPHHRYTLPEVLMTSSEVQCELLTAANSHLNLATVVAGSPPFENRPSHFVDRWLPPYLSTLSPALKRDAEDILFKIHTVGLEKEDTSTMMSTGGEHEQQLAVARSSVASMRSRLEDMMLKYQKTASALVQATKSGAHSSSSQQSPVSFMDGWGGGEGGERAITRAAGATPDMFPMLPAIPLPSTPRPPTQSRTGGRDGLSRHGTRGKQHAHKLNFDEGLLPSSISSPWEHSAVSSSAHSSLLTYFVEDVCSLLRDARTTLFDLDKIHWRLVSHSHKDASTSSPHTNERHTHNSRHRTTTTTTTTVLSHNDVHLHREESKRNHPFHTCTSPVLARIAEVLTISLRNGREAPRFLTNIYPSTSSTIRQTYSRAGGSRQQHNHSSVMEAFSDASSGGSELSSMLQHCWQMLVDFLDGQVHHAQTMVFVREPNLDVWMRESPTLASLVAQAAAPDVPKLPKIV
ncbi:Hypothetical protein, putative [Bodo saltans]|uniref:Uncharacterized protein n=1 Tax=Bodo saltans TaxID=75058 RepID=A0A0S4JJE8_BODSA|nr:Hypothetical protein, putative [Bodo saltans]|eukprot:CUG90308.1 Hypothetical protein, putative [Bodo saltans]